MKLVDPKAKTASKPIDRVEKLEKEVANLSMATRISQMLLKQMMEQNQKLSGDLRATTGMLNDYQYRFLALQGHLGVDVNKLAVDADGLKLKDWNDASDRDDVENKFVPANVVSDVTNTVIFASTTPDLPEDKGIFRSKVVLADTGSKEFIDAVLGKTVGDVFDVKLNNDLHRVTLLGVRVAPVSESAAEASGTAAT